MPSQGIAKWIKVPANEKKIGMLKVEEIGEHDSMAGRVYPLYKIHDVSMMKGHWRRKEEVGKELIGMNFFIKGIRVGKEAGHEHISSKKCSEHPWEINGERIARCAKVLAHDKENNNLWVEFIPGTRNPSEFEFRDLPEFLEYLKQIVRKFALMAKDGMIWHEPYGGHCPLMRDENGQIVSYVFDMGQAFFPELMPGLENVRPDKDTYKYAFQTLLETIGEARMDGGRKTIRNKGRDRMEDFRRRVMLEKNQVKPGEGKIKVGGKEFNVFNYKDQLMSIFESEFGKYFKKS